MTLVELKSTQDLRELSEVDVAEKALWPRLDLAPAFDNHRPDPVIRRTQT